MKTAQDVSVETSQAARLDAGRAQTLGRLRILRRAQTAGRLFEGHTGPNGHTDRWGTGDFADIAPPVTAPSIVAPPFPPDHGPSSPPRRRPAVSALRTLGRRSGVLALRTSVRAGWDVSTEPVVVFSASGGL